MKDFTSRQEGCEVASGVGLAQDTKPFVLFLFSADCKWGYKTGNLARPAGFVNREGGCGEP